MAPDDIGIAYMAEFFEGKIDGYLIDVGAHDGVAAGSMTRFLMEWGWRGMLIEPLPEAYALLEKAYAGVPDVVTFNVACSDEEGTAELYPCKGVTTMDTEWRDACDRSWKHVNYGSPFFASKRTLHSLMNLAGSPDKVDLLQIDTEGHDLQVLKGMDWSRQPDMVVAESLDMTNLDRKINGIPQPSDEMVEYMESKGYYVDLLTKGGNVFFIRMGI
jgi:FkbM family methyltransferase